MTLHIDFETRSDIDLRQCGVHAYSVGALTAVLCMGYAFDDEPVELWVMGEPFPQRVIDYVSAGGDVYAHNAAFELAMWNNRLRKQEPGIPPLTVAQTHCTQALALSMSYPPSLEQLAKALRLSVQKDAEGRKAMLKLCKPRPYSKRRHLSTWYEEPGLYQTLYAYCKTDVDVERQAHKKLVALSASERNLWEVDQRINNRGVYVDLPVVEKAIKILEVESERINAEVAYVTEYQASGANSSKSLVSWLQDRGVDTGTIAKRDVANMLLDARIEGDVRRVLELRQEGSKSSTAKYQKMLDCVSPDGRLRGLFQYHAASTGRWGGRLIQPQNLPRPKLEQIDIEDAILAVEKLGRNDAMAYLQLAYGSPTHVLSDCIRGMLRSAPDHRLLCGDYSNIEGRVLAWLAGAHWKIRAFEEYDAKTGPDLYLLAYSKAYHVPISEVTKGQRQAGKVMELAFGYQGGRQAAQNMAVLYGLEMSDSLAMELRDAWRVSNPEIVVYWQILQDAAFKAVKNPGTKVAVGHIAFRVMGPHLWVRLPSGRVLCYPEARIENAEKRGLVVTYMARDEFVDVDGKSVKMPWGRAQAYGGKWAENITQAVARDILSSAILRLEDAGYPVVMHIHDEIVAELATGHGTLNEFVDIMEETPPWAVGCPITVGEPWEGERFRK